MKSNLILASIVFVVCIFIYYNRSFEERDYSGFVYYECNFKGVPFYSIRVCTSYNENGIIEAVERYVNNSLDGNLQHYYKNGQLEYTIEYKDGKIWNVSEYYDNKGNSLDIGTLEDGFGTLVCYTPNGNISRTGEIENGLKVNIWYTYTNNELRDSSQYIYGVEQGPWSNGEIDYLVY